MIIKILRAGLLKDQKLANPQLILKENNSYF